MGEGTGVRFRGGGRPEKRRSYRDRLTVAATVRAAVRATARVTRPCLAAGREEESEARITVGADGAEPPE
jgi:hypothetical protein